jgi:hypothetical protein
MSSIFTGGKLKIQYNELTHTAINATTDASDAALLTVFTTNARLCFMFNGTNIDLTLWAVHPQADASVTANRLKMMEFPANYNLNFDPSAVNLEFDPGMRLYVSRTAAGGTAGANTKFRIVYW